MTPDAPTVPASEIQHLIDKLCDGDALHTQGLMGWLREWFNVGDMMEMSRRAEAGIGTTLVEERAARWLPWEINEDGGKP